MDTAVLQNLSVFSTGHHFTTHMLCDLCIPVLGKDTHWLLLLTAMLRRHSVSPHHHRLFCCCLKQETHCGACTVLYCRSTMSSSHLAWLLSFPSASEHPCEPASTATHLARRNLQPTEVCCKHCSFIARASCGSRCCFVGE